MSALIFRSQGLQVGTVVNGAEAQLVSIMLGRDFGNEVEVVAGLPDNSTVITNPPDSLVSGEKIRVVGSPAPAAGQGM